ncbi:unnamed protein product, partial [Symbiodinium sp. KB8]
AQGGMIYYSFLNCFAFCFLASTGLFAAINAFIPPWGIAPIILFVGLAICQDAFDIIKARHLPAAMIGLFPAVADWILSIWPHDPKPPAGLAALAHGSLLVCIAWVAIGVFIIDRNYMKAAIWALVAMFISGFGLMHAESADLTFKTFLGCRVGDMKRADDERDKQEQQEVEAQARQEAHEDRVRAGARQKRRRERLSAEALADQRRREMLREELRADVFRDFERAVDAEVQARMQQQLAQAHREESQSPLVVQILSAMHQLLVQLTTQQRQVEERFAERATFLTQALEKDQGRHNELMQQVLTMIAESMQSRPAAPSTPRPAPGTPLW